MILPKILCSVVALPVRSVVILPVQTKAWSTKVFLYSTKNTVFAARDEQ